MQNRANAPERTWEGWVSPYYIEKELMDTYAFHAAAGQSPNTNDEVLGLIEEEIASLQYKWVIAWERYLREREKITAF